MRVFRMGSSYGGILTEVGQRKREGGVACPVCGSDGFEPVRFERWVRCTHCATVFVQRRSKQMVDVLGEATKELVDYSKNRTKTRRPENRSDD